MREEFGVKEDVSGLPGVEIDDSYERVQMDALWDFLSHEATWGTWRTRAVIQHQLAVAWRVVGAYEMPSGDMIGFARAMSDGYGVAYLADVFVIPRMRQRGIGVAVVDFMVNTGKGADFRWMLHTTDAHGLYARLGFLPPDHTYLERPSPLVAQQALKADTQEAAE